MNLIILVFSGKPFDMANMMNPTGKDFDRCLELIAAAAIATQEDDGPPPKPEDKPPATVTAAYAARKPAPTKPTKPAARVVKPANPLTTVGAKSIYSARRPPHK